MRQTTSTLFGLPSFSEALAAASSSLLRPTVNPFGRLFLILILILILISDTLAFILQPFPLTPSELGFSLMLAIAILLPMTWIIQEVAPKFIEGRSEIRVIREIRGTPRYGKRCFKVIQTSVAIPGAGSVLLQDWLNSY